LSLILSTAVFLVAAGAASAVTFTNDTLIRSYNTNYDDLDVVVTNCTLTVDGPHSFASLQVLNGANLAHSPAPDGYLYNAFAVIDEPQVLSLTNVATLLNAPLFGSSVVVQDATGAVTYTNGVDYEIGTDTNGMTTLLLTANSAIAEGSTNLVSYDYYTTVAGGLSLTVTGDVTVAQGATINADGRGYEGRLGPGHGNSSGTPMAGTGAGHGGFGGPCEAYVGTGGGVGYDSIQQPALLGSGGGTGYGGLGGSGGGSIKLVVGGTLRVDGAVSANGASATNNRAGGGSGGSIWLSAASVVGTGTLSVSGGAGEPARGGGGGGGRISLQYDSHLFTGATYARGGSGYVRGGAGTLYTRANSQPTGQVLVDNGGRSGERTSFSSGEAFDLTAQGGALIVVEATKSFGNLLVKSNAWLNLVQNEVVTVTGNATIQAGGGVSADGAGYTGGQGPGAGRPYAFLYNYTGGGGGYGGYGATGGSTNAYGGTTYGSVLSPTDLGSGGGTLSPYALGGSGGGAMRLNVIGMLLLDGTISADGNAGLTAGGGGGSGGSVWLTVGTLAGAGTISADGGMGNGVGLGAGGGGGGGRIAIQYTTDLFFGATSARGGGGAGYGGAGTIYTRANSQSWGQVLADNGGQAGTNTTLGSSSPSTVDLTVRGGAVVSPQSSQAFGTLLVASNGWLSLANHTLYVTGNATVQAGGGIIADGSGNRTGTGPGAGRYTYSGNTYIGGGGGYGGCGASGASGGSSVPYGGIAYGYVTGPMDLGSGGGGYYYNPGMGGAGGGAVRLMVTGVLQVDGRISAAGAAAPSASGGGGSGGSVYLTVGTLAGSGAISVNGGAGNCLGGGGGGGRIAVLYSTYSFSGLVSAYGGSGYAPGGAGTIYTKANSQPYGLIVADNGGQAGTNTSWSPAGTVDLVVRGGAVVVPPYSQSLSGLLVASNGWILMTNAGQQMTVGGKATIQAGGGIIADGAGYAGGSGPGAGKYTSAGSYGYIGSGGGYGGYGGAGNPLPDYPSPSGGNTYGYLTTPTDPGSGGGGYSPYAMGGSGGGAIRLTVTGLLQVDGRISAQGRDGNNPSAGGGSGGSIYLTVGSLAGSGVISANGGAGNFRGGGGGGGRIAVVFSSSASVNGFTGQMSAYGGSGYTAGGAGTIYLKPYSTTQGPTVVLLDNGGQAGTNSGWPIGPTTDLILRSGASLGLPSSSQTIPGNLLISSNGWIYIAGSAGLYGPTLNVLGNATIQAGGGIMADGGGYSYYNGGPGPGAGRYAYNSSGGGGFGGCGGNSGGSPAATGGGATGSVSTGGAGSAGGTSGSSFVGGAGGGAISINVTGALQVDGRISSAGGPGVSANAGGGAGGGIAITAGTLAGSGVIAANGGAGNGLGGGGGGGRIVINCNTANGFGGAVSAYGGAGYVRGGAGTIYTSTRSAYPLLLADNGGYAGTNTSLTGAGTINLTVTGGAIVALQFPMMMLANLMVTSNSWIIVSNQTLTVTSNATVQAGGGIIADGTGYGGNAGMGAGRYASGAPTGNVGGGGGNGGYGASGGSNTLAYGGSPYRLMMARPELGSGGGSSSVTSLPPGAGGGALELYVVGALLVNGRISADGGAATGQGSGGGSGGTVWLTAGTLAGVGTISANGGAGNGWGGGGGGGRVAIQYGVNAFEGTVSASGGGGYAWGGAGTIYTKANSQTMGQMLVDNGGHAGTNTPLAFMSPFDLTVGGGAVAYPSSSSLVLSNLLIASGGVFTCGQGQTNLDVEVLRNATIDAGGVMAVDGMGFAAGAGPGAGLASSHIGSGAGYGGAGGASSMSPGGGTYGSAQAPVDQGSGGGLGYGLAPEGSEGGGAIRLTVGGALAVNGQISANGNAGMQDDAGGGSGGSVWLSAAALTGTGTIAADGGAGELFDGGGGGGGRIALCTPLNLFGGLVSADGGEGFFPGETSTVYYAAAPVVPEVVSIAPTGVFTAAVSTAEVVFNGPVNAYTVKSPGVLLAAPGGLVVSNITSTALSSHSFQLSFPSQTAQGDYTLTVGPPVADLYGQALSQVYTGMFSVAWATILGIITDTNGQPVPDVVVQSDGGGDAATTDTNGNYVLAVPPGGAVVVTPSKSGLVFLPSSRTYYDVTSALTNGDYVAMPSVTPTLTLHVETNGLVMNWYGISGVTYQLLYSLDLAVWMPHDNPVLGTNGPLEMVVPVDAEPIKYFRLVALY